MALLGMMAAMTEIDDRNNEFREDSFVHVLIGDASKSLDALNDSDTQFGRRSAVRMVFSAVEGLMSVVRTSLEVLPLTAGESCVVREQAYEVSENGEVKTRQRFVPLGRSIKSAVRIVRRLRPEYDLDYDHPGWPALLRSLQVRHRITHAKKLDDLTVADSEAVVAR